MIRNLPSQIFVLLILILSFGQLPASGTVLCFGNDGHVAIEKATYALNCTHPLNSHSEPLKKLNLFNSITDLNHCGSCNDVSLSNKNLESKIVSAGFSILDINPGSSFFTTFNFPPELKAGTNKKDYRIHSKSVNYSYLPQIEKVVIIC